MTTLTSIHTHSFPEILDQLGISLIVSTYQAGKVILLRNDGGTLNTHFKSFDQPMGIAINQNKITLGTKYQIIDLHNLRALAPKVEPLGKHDACYLPRGIHFTGDIDIHEMTYVGDELWFINTKFSCLCTLDKNYSFVPRWHPPFISAYDVTDRCHLNGLTTRDNQVKYVSALGTTDKPSGWRENKARGGMVMDISNNEFICQGLSMPHSPRWHEDNLWIMESGNGSIAKVDLDTGKWEDVAILPGFTRGIDFWGDYAFIGLSQVRESAVFSGIPIAQRLKERICGVWIVNLKTGSIEGFLRFTQGVEEIFAVQVLPHSFPEMIMDSEELLCSSYVIPDEALALVAKPSADDIARHQQKITALYSIDSFVVVIPVFNIESKFDIDSVFITPKKSENTLLEKTLISVENSIQYFREKYPNGDKFDYQIVIVDDASTDNTQEIIKNLIKDKKYYRYIRHDKNKGQGAARNTGVNVSTQKAIFFCDDDDLFLPEHIYTCIDLLNKPLSKNYNSMVKLPGNYPGAVKTGVVTQDKLHPHWYKTIVNSLPINTCVRREVHHLIEGFPDDQVFRDCSYSNEDFAYASLLTTFFNVVWVDTPTVEYIRYSGSHFDRQLRRFQHPPGEYQEEVSKQDKLYLQEINKIIIAKRKSIKEKINISKKGDIYLNWGNQAYNKHDLKKAINYYHHSLFLNPNLIHARYNLGVCHFDLQEYDVAIRILQQVVTIEPNYVEAYNILGRIHSLLEDYNKAINYYQEAISLRHNFPDAHFNLGITLLKLGRFEEGWKEYEWRWQRADFSPLQCPQSQWDGGNIEDKSILVHTEQGAGDSIHFVRYLPILAKRCGRLILCCPDNLVKLFETVEGIDQIYTPGKIPFSDFDCYVPLMSLPYLLGTRLDNIPDKVPYLGVNLPKTTIDDKLANLIKSNGKINIGIVWAGSPTHKGDRTRSCNLKDFLLLLSLEGFNFYSLQKGEKATQIAQLPPEREITDLSNYLADYSDTAKVITHLDLVISVDTSVAHLAGALGKPIWLILGYNHDWRWLLNRNDSPWYPTMRVFRQEKAFQWQPVFTQVQEQLISGWDKLSGVGELRYDF